MSGAEFAGWRAFDTISPIGGERADRHAALISTLIANANRSAKQDPFSLDDFDLYRERRPLTRAEEEANFRARWRAAGLVQRRVN